MQWLILTENQEKAAACRRAIPEATCISTKGFPWDAEVPFDPDDPLIQYKRGTKIPNDPLLLKIQNTAAECDRILLAFDPTTEGEASAAEFEQILGRKKCARWGALSLLPSDIQQTIAKFESLPSGELPNANQGLASSYWCKTVMDIIWTHCIEHWLETHTARTERITRLMGGMLRTVADEQRKKERFHPHKYWEVITTLKKQSTGKKFSANIIVPTFAQLGAGAPTKTREIWNRRMEEARTTTIQGTGIPQPEPGKPWRYKSWEEVALQKTHLQKFPFFLVESNVEHETETEVKPPLTTSAVLRIGTKTGKGNHQAILRSLAELYHEGHITHPKTTNPNLWKKTVDGLLRFGTTKNLPMCQESREFTEEDDKPRAKSTEALRPTIWSRHPDEMEAILLPNKNRELKCWLYRIIHQRAIGSQLAAKSLIKKKHYLMGPLYLTKKGAEEREGKSFKIAREHSLQAHMNVILCTEEENPKDADSPQEGEVMECTHTQIIEKTTDAPNQLTEEELFDLMTTEGLGKRETLIDRLELLKKQGCVVTENNEVKLTPKGRSLINLLNNNFGQFLDQNYHRTIAENLRMIEEGKLEEEDFLQDWWACFRTFLEEEETPNAENKTKNLWGEEKSA